MSEKPDFTSLDWSEIVPKLIAAADQKMRKMIWRGERNGHPPGGRTARDFVQTGVMKVVSGQRCWDPACSPLRNFWNAVSGEIINAATSAENMTTVRVDEKVVYIRTRELTPEQQAQSNIDLERFLVYLQRHDPLAKQMAEIMLTQGVTEIVELSIRLQISYDKAKVLIKKLRLLSIEYKRDSEKSKEGA